MNLNEKALSKKQQRFFGIVRATQKGTFKGETTPQVQRAASSMKKKDVKKFASTKHEGLPEKKVAIKKEAKIFNDPRLNRIYPNQPKLTQKGIPAFRNTPDPNIFHGNKKIGGGMLAKNTDFTRGLDAIRNNKNKYSDLIQKMSYEPEGEMVEKTCGKGEYYCHNRKKCMPIPKGAKVGKDGMLVKEKLNIGEGSLHKWFKGSKSKDGKGGWVNVVTGGTCASDEPGEGTPKCVSSSKRASMSKAERLSAARRKKKADPNQQSKSGAAKPTYVSTDKPKKKMKEAMETDSSKKRAQAILDAKRKREEDKMLAKKEEVQTHDENFMHDKSYVQRYKKQGGYLNSPARKKADAKYEKNRTKELARPIKVKKGQVMQDSYVNEAKIDKIDPKNKRKRRNEVTFGKQTKPYDPPGKAYKNEMGKFLQKQRKERHDKMRGVKTKLKEYSLDEMETNALQRGALNLLNKSEKLYKSLTTNKDGKLNLGGKIIKNIFGPVRDNPGSNYTKDGKQTFQNSYTPPGEVVFEKVYVDESDKKGKGSGSKDACYHKVKSRYSVWPSAYASGALVKCRKVGAANWGNSSKKEDYGMINFQDFIYEKCWKGYEKKGMKTMFGKRYPNCVKKEEADLPVDECWKTHKKVGMKMKGGKLVNDCRPKNEERTPAIPGEMGPEYMKNVRKSINFMKNTTVNPKNFKLPGEKGRMNYLKSLNMGEAVETKKKEEKKPKKAMDAGARGRRLLQRKEYRAKVSEFIPKELEDQVQYNVEDWQKKSGKNPSGGLNEKGRKSYERQNPGSDLKAPTKSKTNPRRKSFCARMKGMKKRLTSAKTARDPDSRINKALRKWDC